MKRGNSVASNLSGSNSSVLSPPPKRAKTPTAGKGQGKGGKRGNGKASGAQAARAFVQHGGQRCYT